MKDVFSLYSIAFHNQDYLASFEVRKIDKEKFEVEFIANYKVQDTNRQARLGAFQKLQLELLTKLKLISAENK